MTSAFEAAPDTGTAQPPHARTGIWVLSAVAVLLLAAVVGLSLLVHSHRTHREDLERAKVDSVAAARQAIINLDSLSSATIDADMKRVVDGSTGQFKSQFTSSQADLKQIIASHKTVSSGSVVASATVSVDTDAAVVLVAVDRTIKDTTSPSGVISNDRWKVTLELHAGRWLVANLAAVS